MHIYLYTHTHQAKRQQRKLNFLITQTELYAHFMAKKLTGEEDLSGEILRQLEDGPLQREVQPGMVVDLETPGEYDSQAMKAKALANVEAALVKQEKSVSQWRREGGGRGGMVGMGWGDEREGEMGGGRRWDE